MPNRPLDKDVKAPWKEPERCAKRAGSMAWHGTVLGCGQGMAVSDPDRNLGLCCSESAELAPAWRTCAAKVLLLIARVVNLKQPISALPCLQCNPSSGRMTLGTAALRFRRESMAFKFAKKERAWPLNLLRKSPDLKPEAAKQSLLGAGDPFSQHAQLD